jgi:excinuclease ABC subunit C
VSAAFEFQHRLAFDPADADRLLREIPAAAGVVALRGADPAAEPYLTRAADIRRRLRRLLAPPELLNEAGQPVLSKRLNLRNKVRSIEWTRTGSEFESVLVLYCATRAIFGPEPARRRLRLHAPCFLRVTRTHAHPRVYATNKLSRRALDEFIGPYPSRAAAERHADAVLELFKLRRCHEDLEPFPGHPGCAYGEMQKCMAPCQARCTTADYLAESELVYDFLATRGESMLSSLAAQREAASEAMDFERAAALHAQWEKARAAALLADELIRPLPDLRVLIVQKAAPRDSPGAEDPAAPDAASLDAAIFLLERGRLAGPGRLSTLGVRAVREQTAVGSSLFAQPLMLAPIPLAEPISPADKAADTTDPGVPGPDPRSRDSAAPGPATTQSPSSSTLSPEDRARNLLADLHTQIELLPEPDIAERADILSLFRRWFYRPEKQRAGECFLPAADATWPVRRILNAAARAVLGSPTEAAPVQRDAAREAASHIKTRVLHEGREGVERIVPVLPKRKRRGALSPAQIAEESRQS